MTTPDPAAATGPRFTRTRALVALGIALLAIGLCVLLLPYDRALALPGAEVPLGGTIVASCESPLIDVFRPEPDGWLNYQPDGAGESRGDAALSGSWCAPESFQRAAVGGLLVVVGTASLVPLAVAHRRRRTTADPVSPAQP